MKLKETDIEELYFIAHIENVPSILRLGLLSHNMMIKRKIRHVSVASTDVQARRINKTIPGGRKLHDYVNTYFNARNPMLYVLIPKQMDLCVLRISSDILRVTGIVISDQNAARGWARFEPAPDGFEMLDKDEIFALSWNHADYFEKDRLKGVMCAEVLVPDKVESKYIKGAYVSCQEALDRLAELCPSFPITMNKTLFFQ